MRALTDEERAALQRRVAELRHRLLPFDPEESSLVEASVAGMLSGFRSMRQTDEAAEVTLGITSRVLAEYPLWAIEETCLAIARGKAGNRKFPPNDSEMCSLVDGRLWPYRAALARAEALLAAPVQRPTPLRSRPRISGPPGAQPISGEGHGARVAADLERRRSERTEQDNCT